jgi:arylesterase/paraoxonase
MKRMLALLVLLVVAVIGYRIVTRSGVLRTIVPHREGECRTVAGIVGGEDVTIDRETMTAYVSADDRRAVAAGRPARGEIYAIDLTRPEAAPVALTGGTPADFHPHGLSLWREPDGRRRLFAIKHLQGGGQSVAVFDVGANGLSLAESITYPDLRSPNDLVAVGPRQFYATNDRRYPDPSLMATLEGYLQLPLASVSYFDGSTGRLVAHGLAFTNGINATADGRRVLSPSSSARMCGSTTATPRAGHSCSVTRSRSTPVRTTSSSTRRGASGSGRTRRYSTSSPTVRIPRSGRRHRSYASIRRRRR